jgi:hypothetical protein
MMNYFHTHTIAKRAATAVAVHIKLPISHPSPRIGACTPVTRGNEERGRCSGFEPAKALPLPLTRVLPSPSPLKGLPYVTGGSACVAAWRGPGWDGVLGRKTTNGKVGCCFQPSLLCRLGIYVCASVQRLTNPFGCRCESKTESYGPHGSVLLPWDLPNSI